MARSVNILCCGLQRHKMICDKFDSCGLHCPHFELRSNGNMPSGNQCNLEQG